jgi:hypothetical protein
VNTYLAPAARQALKRTLAQRRYAAKQKLKTRQLSEATHTRYRNAAFCKGVVGEGAGPPSLCDVRTRPGAVAPGTPGKRQRCLTADIVVAPPVRRRRFDPTDHPPRWLSENFTGPEPVIRLENPAYDPKRSLTASSVGRPVTTRQRTFAPEAPYTATEQRERPSQISAHTLDREAESFQLKLGV